MAVGMLMALLILLLICFYHYKIRLPKEKKAEQKLKELEEIKREYEATKTISDAGKEAEKFKTKIKKLEGDE